MLTTVANIITLDMSDFTFQKATKTKPIEAKPVTAAIVDPNVIKSLQLETPEGLQPLDPARMLCRGVGGEYWQQTVQKLHEKYVQGSKTDQHMWVTYYPKPENQVDAVQILLSSLQTRLDDEQFQVEAQWGTKIGDKYYQRGVYGDYVLKSISDPADIWIVKKSFFEATYDMV